MLANRQTQSHRWTHTDMHAHHSTPLSYPTRKVTGHYSEKVAPVTYYQHFAADHGNGWARKFSALFRALFVFVLLTLNLDPDL